MASTARIHLRVPGPELSSLFDATGGTGMAATAGVTVIPASAVGTGVTGTGCAWATAGAGDGVISFTPRIFIWLAETRGSSSLPRYSTMRPLISTR